MSIPQIYLSASGSTGPSTVVSNDLRKFQSSSKENIRERLNMHVKKRIQGHDIIGQYPMPITSPASSIYSNSISASQQTHPFLMAGASGTMPPVMMFANSLISVASDYSNSAGRTIQIPQIERQLYAKTSNKSPQPKKLTKNKKTITNNKKKIKQHVDANQQAENLILNTKFSDDSNDFHDSAMNCSSSISPQENRNYGDSSAIPNDNKLTNTPDILSMVLGLKKNALMHDPYVIQFISAIR